MHGRRENNTILQRIDNISNNFPLDDVDFDMDFVSFSDYRG